MRGRAEGRRRLDRARRQGRASRWSSASSAPRRGRRARRWRSARAARSSGAVSRRLRRGRGRRGRRGGHRRRRSRSCCTSASPTRRRGTSGCRAAARSTSGWSATSRERRRDASPRSRATTVAARSSPRSRAATSARKLLVLPDGTRRGHARSPELDDEARAPRRRAHVGRALRARGGEPLFVDVTFPPPRLIIFGAIDFAAQLCTLARTSGWRPVRVRPARRSSRARPLPRRRGGHRRLARRGVRALGGIDRATSIAVLTHDPKLDDAALEIALRSDAAYVGAMGSHARAGQAPRPARGQGHHRRRARAPHRADRPRPRRADARGDGAVDHGRDRRPAPRPRGRAARARARAASTRSTA